MMDPMTSAGLADEVVGRLGGMETVRLEFVAKPPGIIVKEGAAREGVTNGPRISTLNCVLDGEGKSALESGVPNEADDIGKNDIVDAVTVVETSSEAECVREIVEEAANSGENHIVVDAVTVAVRSKPDDWATAACATKRRVAAVELEDAAETSEQALDRAVKLQFRVEVATMEELVYWRASAATSAHCVCSQQFTRPTNSVSNCSLCETQVREETYQSPSIPHLVLPLLCGNECKCLRQ